MKKIICLVILLALVGCATSTSIKTVQKDVRVYNDGVLKGVTPFDYWDRQVMFTQKTFMLKKEGFVDKEITIQKNIFYFHRLLFPPVLAWLWMFGYDTEYYFELEAVK